jgi:hypothetical protein
LLLIVSKLSGRQFLICIAPLFCSVLNEETLTTCKALDGVRVMVFKATFNNISVISWWSDLLVEEMGENHRPIASH